MTDPVFSSFCSLSFFGVFILLTADLSNNGLKNDNLFQNLYKSLNFHDCPSGALGSVIFEKPGAISGPMSANIICLGLCIGSAFSLIASFGGSAFRPSLNGDLLVRRQGIYVTGAIMLMSIVKFSLVLAGVTRIGCYSDLNYVFDPFQYVYWLSTTPTMLIMFGRMGGQETSFLSRSAILIGLTMIFGFISAVTMALESFKWRLFSAIFFCLSCLAFYFVSRLSVQIFHGAHDASLDHETRQLLRKCYPPGSLLWILFPIISLSERIGVISPLTAAIIWPILESFAKVFMCVIWTAGDFTRHQFLAREKIINSDNLRAISDNRSSSMRSLTRYLFHELRVPLNAIVLGIEECREDLHDLINRNPSMRQSSMAVTLGTVSNNALAMNKLLDDFLSLEKIEEGKIELMRSLIHVEPFVRGTVSLFSPLAVSKKLEITIEIDPSAPRVINGDENKVRQVLCNYLSNAIKFTPMGGHIIVSYTSQLSLDDTPSTHLSRREAPSGGSPGRSIQDSPSTEESLNKPKDKSSMSAASTLRKRGVSVSTTPKDAVADQITINSSPFVRFSVTDTGPGISEIDAKKLFEPFVQIRAGSTQKGNGTGLGLSICKRLVELFGGVAGVHTREGSGSSFYFVMPTGMIFSDDVTPTVSSASSVVSQKSNAPLSPPVSTIKQLLSCIVVDDVESNRVLLGRMLTRRGVTSVLLAADGKETLFLLDRPEVRASVQCIFLDAQMPIMDGLECAVQIRASGSNVLIVGVTGNALESDRLAFIKAGATSVLTKPVNVNALEKMLESHGLSLAARKTALST